MKHLMVCIFFFVVSGLSGWAQQKEPAENKPPTQLKKYESGLFKSSVDTNLVSLSLVSPTLYNNWDIQLKIFKQRYIHQNALLMISKADSHQKMEFVTEFMKLRNAGKDLIIAYAEALQTVSIKYPELDFKHHLHLKE